MASSKLTLGEELAVVDVGWVDGAGQEDAQVAAAARQREGGHVGRQDLDDVAQADERVGRGERLRPQQVGPHAPRVLQRRHPLDDVP